jgi:flagellar motor switch protein FliN/FliY
MNATPSYEEIGAAAAASGTLDLLMDMELPVLIRFGTTRMLLGDLLRLNAGSVIEFERASENSVEILVNDRVVARGEAVVVQGYYGVRISEMLAAPGRILAGEALS